MGSQMKRSSTVFRDVAVAVALLAVVGLYVMAYAWLLTISVVVAIVLGATQLTVIVAVIVSGYWRASRTRRAPAATAPERGSPTAPEPETTIDLRAPQLAPDNVASLDQARAERSRRIEDTGSILP